MIIGREKELKILNNAYNDEYSQFVVVYGRRRVGKTFLVREAFDYKFTFQHSGIANASREIQLEEWTKSLQKAGLKVSEKPKNWFDAFSLLDELISRSRAKRKVVFIDELPWMDTQSSNFVSALEHFWNAYASARKDVLLIVCGSATSWIVDNIVHNHGGLHNRLNHKINLRQFTLHECEMYVRYKKMSMQHRQIMECYMVLGGVPYYWSLLKREESLSQNIDRLFFSDDGELKWEFDALYLSLFKHPEAYIDVVNALGSKRAGMTREQIICECGLSDNGKLTKVLNDLEHCGFIRKYTKIGNTTKDSLFQLVDFYTLFYYKFVKENKRADVHFWSKNMSSPIYNNWCGLAFERLCLAHVEQIKRALGIDGIMSNEYSWNIRKTDEHYGAQIDLLIDRSDNAINLCEMKYSAGEYVLEEKEERNIINRREVFVRETHTNKAIHLTLITNIGLARNTYSDVFQNVVTADALFAM